MNNGEHPEIKSIEETGEGILITVQPGYTIGSFGNVHFDFCIYDNDEDLIIGLESIRKIN